MEADDFINNQTPVEPVEEAIQEQFDFLLDGPMHTVQDMLYTWGGVYIGSWHEDNPDGVGVLSLANGQVTLFSIISSFLKLMDTIITDIHRDF